MKAWLREMVLTALRGATSLVGRYSATAAETLAFFTLSLMSSLTLQEYLSAHPEEWNKKVVPRAIAYVVAADLEELKCPREAEYFAWLAESEGLDGPLLSAALDTMVDEPANLGAVHLLIAVRDAVALQWPFPEQRMSPGAIARKLGFVRAPDDHDEAAAGTEIKVHFAFRGTSSTLCGQELPGPADDEWGAAPQGSGKPNLVWTTLVISDQGGIALNCGLCAAKLKEAGEGVLARHKGETRFTYHGWTWSVPGQHSRCIVPTHGPRYADEHTSRYGDEHTCPMVVDIVNGRGLDVLGENGKLKGRLYQDRPHADKMLPWADCSEPGCRDEHTRRCDTPEANEDEDHPLASTMPEAMS